MWYNNGVIEDTDLSWLAGIFESRRNGISIRRGYPTGSTTSTGIARNNSMNILGVVVIRFADRDSLARAMAIVDSRGLDPPGLARYGLLLQLTFTATNGGRFLDLVKAWLTNPLLKAQVVWYQALFNKDTEGVKMVEDRQKLYWEWVNNNKEWNDKETTETQTEKLGA